MGRMFRIAAVLGFLGLLGTGIAGWLFLGYLARDLPDHNGLVAYEPPVLARVHAADGAVVGVFARQHRVFTPVEEIPETVRQAFISAEDKNFYRHAGIDPTSIAKAVLRNIGNVLSGRRLQGASTITQQVAKNMLLSSEVTLARKIREGVLAGRLDQALPKDRILELYLNEIYLGARAYGVAAAAQVYFGKPLDDLALWEAAYLAALPKAPNNYHPVRHPERARGRRAYVLNRMAEDGFITVAQAQQAAGEPLQTVLQRPKAATTAVGPYFVEEVRRLLLARYGEDTVYEGGLSVRTSLSRRYQAHAEQALRAALEKFDRKRGYTGPVARLAGLQQGKPDQWRRLLADVRAPRDITGWHLAVILAVDDTGARIGVEGVPGEENRIPLADAQWARERLVVEERPDEERPERRVEVIELGPAPATAHDLWAVGDVVFVKALGTESENAEPLWSLRQIPELQGAFFAMDVRTGRVLAMQGGFSFAASTFNRVTQARRQPGSAFKPVVYAAALDHGYTPATPVLDAPLAMEQGVGLEMWRPGNYGGRFVGPAPLRRALEESRNLMTVRVARKVGLEQIGAYAESLGIYKEMPPLMSHVLGAGETGLMELVRAYAAFANGGYRVDPVLVDRVQNRRGKTIFRADDRPCVGCRAKEWFGQERPYVPERGTRVLSPETAFQIAWMLEGAVQHGTGRAARVKNLEVGGKTGTTNAYRDAWFIGFTPEVVAGCYIGYDTPRTMGRGGTGGSLCAPVVGKFFAGLPARMRGRHWPRPTGLTFVHVERGTGIRVPDGAAGAGTVEEAFRPDQVPAPGRRPSGLQPGTGGIY